MDDPPAIAPADGPKTAKRKTRGRTVLRFTFHQLRTVTA
jgi:hypothetical protein